MDRLLNVKSSQLGAKEDDIKTSLKINISPSKQQIEVLQNDSDSCADSHSDIESIVDSKEDNN